MKWPLTVIPQAEKDKERYKREMASYVPPAGFSSQGAKGGKGKKAPAKKKKDPNAPKRGTTSFMFFSTEMRSKIKEENPDITFGQMVSSRLRNQVGNQGRPKSHQLFTLG